MAKKKTQLRRVPRATEPRMYGDGKPSQAAQQTGAAAPTNTATTGSRPLGSRPVTQGRPANLASSRTAGVAARVPVTTTQSYDYVLKDLRRLGILAAAFFVLLIGLGLVIR